ncbi:hypothetical protein C8A00DRAFT_11290 [Chaetomidium leptoderma]|uniref:Uncharacterized protein n=1 Tax=Chaetomidium leptoderma TaxID=669021 RepID=A0AAN6VU85_9PEZI|nr:hypothetical protein C8A00DRAFT_11290 [Chaetomidium leptoderma]
MAHTTPFHLLTLLLLVFLPVVLAQVATVTTTTTATPTLTRLIDIFFLNERDYEGLPYTLFHRDSGSVVAVDAVNNLTTYAITTTRVDRHPLAGATRTDNITTAIPTLEPTRSRHWRPLNGTGQPSTITQGPATFIFTGTRSGPDHTMYVHPPPLPTYPRPNTDRPERINRCSLNGTAQAACNLTHVGSVWYTRDAEWDGTFSTYRYNWTSGDRFGFAPVTITEGAGLLTGPQPTASGGGTSGAVGRREAAAAAAAVVVAVAVGVMVALGGGVGL